jgi:hypothetical protein
MNSVRLTLGKNTAVLRFGKVESKHYVSLANTGPDNLLIYGEIGSKQQEARVEDDEPLLATASARGFTAYWTVVNHGETEVFRITGDFKANTVALHRIVPVSDAEEAEDGADAGWAPVAGIDLDVVPDPEFKIYNYRSEVSVKPLNLPRRPRGRPRKTPASETTAE